jgi:CRISPR system Cascade subunit CasD
MATLLIQLVGPMQSWGTTSRFDQRDTGKEPSKSGVVGMLAAALGIDRADGESLLPVARLSMAVRHDRPGMPRREYQTAGCAKGASIIRANGTQEHQDGVVSHRFYLADAAFLVALEGEDAALLSRIQSALQNPVWALGLGRKAYVPSENIWIEGGLLEASPRAALGTWPWIGRVHPGDPIPTGLLVSWESQDGTGTLRMDQPLSSFADRRFGARFIQSEWIPFPREVANVPA